MSIKLKHSYLLIFTLLSIFVGYAQQFNIEIKKLKIYDIDSIKNQDYKLLSIYEKQYINWQIDLIKNGETDSILPNKLLKTKSKTLKDSILKTLILGDYYLFKEFPKDSLAFDYYIKSFNSSILIKDTLLIAESSKKIFKQLFKSRRSLEVYPIYLKIYKGFLYDDNEKATYFFHFNNHKGSASKIESINDFKQGLKIANKTNNIFLQAKYHQLIGLHYNYYKKQQDSALIYYLEAKRLMESKPYQFFKNELFGILGNIGLTYQNKKEYNKAQDYYLLADKIKLPKYRYVEKLKLNNLIADVSEIQHDWKNSLYFLRRSNAYGDTLNEYTKAAKLSEINTKYETEKKAKENLLLKTDVEKKQRQNRNLWVGSILFLVFGGTTAFLIQKSTKRKQLLAEQEKALETQKLVTVLKEQELTSIDAMIAGQEKERQRIANDLHDDLGGLMATVKLHFNALKDKSSPELFDKTNQLIDEAYNKVRTVAHAKNSGVIAKQGLLKAVHNMAEKISASNKIAIDVVDHGLENRLENSLELTIFRIIQELITNVIKHAEATEATIHITNHDDSLNIMIEDNGKGFNPKQVTKTNKGMGISSIDKRVEHLNGSMTIESEHNKGTTIIIDIPL